MTWADGSIYKGCW
jgi:hypothetical protein